MTRGKPPWFSKCIQRLYQVSAPQTSPLILKPGSYCGRTTGFLSSKHLGGASKAKQDMPAPGTNLPNLKRHCKNLQVAARHRADETYLVEQRRGAPGVHSQMINRSPRIPLLLLTGWVPGDSGFSSHHCSASAHSRVGSTGSPSTAPEIQAPALPHTSHSCTIIFAKPNLQREFLRTSGRLLLGILIIIWFVSSFSENSASYKGLRPDLHTQQPQVPENGQ